jgi:LacI family transcriptional regulator
VTGKNNLKTLADKLGISISTVSRAFAGKKGVSKKQQSAIINLAEKMGIRPDSSASLLRLGKRKGLSLIIPSDTTEISAIRNNLLFSKGLKVFGSNTVFVRQPGEDLNVVIRSAVSRKCEAIILNGIEGDTDPETVKLLKAQRVALLAIDGLFPGFDTINFRRDNGTYQVARLLILSGRRHIHFFTFSDLVRPDSRLKGILAAFDSLNIPRDRLHLLPITTADVENGYQLAKTVLSGSSVDALFCSNDVMAIGAMKALFENHVKVPEEVAVVGFDNLPITQYLSIPLTTVSQPMKEVVDAAFKMLEDRLVNFDQPPVQASFPCHLIVRESATIPSHEIREQVFKELEAVTHRNFDPVSKT